MRRAFALSGVVLTVALAACGSDSGSKDATGSETSSSTTSTTASTTTTTDPCHPVGSVDPQENPVASENQYLTGVASASDGCIDTITFTFRPSAAAAPSYRVEYAQGPFSNSAGEAVNPGGTAFLRVRFEPAWIADLNQESAPLTYIGMRMITPSGTKAVKGLALYDASEAVVGWVVGLDAQHPFTVEGSPGKVVIKVA